MWGNFEILGKYSPMKAKNKDDLLERGEKFDRKAINLKNGKKGKDYNYPSSLPSITLLICY